ncbi:MAG: hypothetical protein V7676_02960 [Parasphingorhabdus sp.]|uniref:hypothetical protein n=1 Tax=Parasphingorhabdus sp. TaxID=2709688 RepID=UPI00300381F4
MSIIQELMSSTASRSPIRDEVRIHWASIIEAEEAGFSMASIFRLLKKNDHPVGKGYSSFAAAVKYWKTHPSLENQKAPEPSQAAVPVRSDEPSAVPQIEKGQTARLPINPYADVRGGNDFGGE